MTPFNLDTLVKELIAIAKADLGKTILPMLVTFMQSVAANPNQINVVAQLAKLEVDVIAALPGIGQDLLKQLVSLLSSEAQNLLTPPSPAPAPAPA